MTATLYKVLHQGRSCHGGALAWSLPTEAADGTWTPGAWMEVAGPLQMCATGLHLTREPARWWLDDSDLYEAEYDGEIIDDGGEKVCVRRCRLLRERRWVDGGVFTEGQHTVRGGYSRAAGTSAVVAWGSAHVEAGGSAHVEAGESAHVVAGESAHVVAGGSAHVEAGGSAHVVAWGSAHVEAGGSAHVVAWESAHVVARGSAHVEAGESAHVVADDNTTVVSTPFHAADATVALHRLAAHIDRRQGRLVLRSATMAMEAGS